MIKFPKKKYDVIYADPPWGSNTQFYRDAKRGNSPHYPLMSVMDIKSLPVSSICSDNSTLLLWVVDSQIPDALSVISSWGFVYKTVGFTWVKKTATGKNHFGVGAWTRKNPEICLLATRGSPKRESASVTQIQEHKVREHSRKPDEIRLEIVKLLGDIPRIELFARQKTKGWDVWGNEV